MNTQTRAKNLAAVIVITLAGVAILGVSGHCQNGGGFGDPYSDGPLEPDIYHDSIDQFIPPPPPPPPFDPWLVIEEVDQEPYSLWEVVVEAICRPIREWH